MKFLVKDLYMFLVVNPIKKSIVEKPKKKKQMVEK